MWEDLFVAIALVLVLEGMMPFLSPQKWRYYIQQVAQQPDKHLRIMGFVSMVVGAILLFAIRA